MLELLSTIEKAARRRWNHRQQFKSVRDWAVSLYDAPLRYFGHVPLPFRRSVVAMCVSDSSTPLYLRLGTSDGAVIEEIFIRQVYEPVVGHLNNPQRIVALGANAGNSVRYSADRLPS